LANLVFLANDPVFSLPDSDLHVAATVAGPWEQLDALSNCNRAVFRLERVNGSIDLLVKQVARSA
jgi:hypothetical protein